MVSLIGGAAAAAEVNYLVIEEGTEPFQYRVGNRPMGMITEIMREVASQSGIEINPVFFTSMAQRRASINQYQHRNWVFFGAREWYQDSVRRAASYSSLPLFNYKVHVLSRKGKNPRFDSISSLKNKRVVLIQGYTYDGFADTLAQAAGALKMEILKAAGHDEAMSLFLAGKADYYLIYKPRGTYLLHKQGHRLEEFDFVSLPQVKPVKVYLMFDKHMPDSLKQSLNKGVAFLRRSGRLNGILRKYL